MRYLPFLLALALAPAASALPSASAQLYAERTALLAGDGQCRLLTPQVRAALSATTIQARFGALREGWTSDALDGVARRADAAGRAHDCADPTLRLAARNAAQGFRGWAKLPAMSFAGVSRQWAARRAPDGDGWMLSQTLPAGAKFGLASDPQGAAQVVLAISASGAPTSASLFLRNRALAPRPYLDVPGVRPQPGLAAGLAPRRMEIARFASQRILYRPKDKPAQILFIFPASLLGEIAQLDPRETVEIELASAGAPARLLIEVGDLAAARAFLAAQAS